MSEPISTPDLEALFEGCFSSPAEALYFQDQARRFTHWKRVELTVGDLALNAPVGPAAGPLLVWPGLNAPLGGWAELAAHQPSVRLQAFEGVLHPAHVWHPQSEQEQHHQKAFAHLEAFGDRRNSDSDAAKEASAFFENDGWHPNAIDADGKTLMLRAMELLASAPHVRAEDALTAMVQRGGNINGLGRVPEGLQVPLKTPVEILLASRHPAPITLDPEYGISERVAQLLEHAQVDWQAPRHRRALHRFFARIHKDNGEMVREPQEGAEWLYRIWREGQLDHGLPLASPAPSKPRF